MWVNILYHLPREMPNFPGPLIAGLDPTRAGRLREWHGARHPFVFFLCVFFSPTGRVDMGMTSGKQVKRDMHRVKCEDGDEAKMFPFFGFKWASFFVEAWIFLKKLVVLYSIFGSFQLALVWTYMVYTYLDKKMDVLEISLSNDVFIHICYNSCLLCW